MNSERRRDRADATSSRRASTSSLYCVEENQGRPGFSRGPGWPKLQILPAEHSPSEPAPALQTPTGSHPEPLSPKGVAFAPRDAAIDGLGTWKAESLGIAPLVASLLTATEPRPFELHFNGLVETALISNGFRRGGGGELSVGAFLPDLRLTAAAAYSQGVVGADVDWIPEQDVLHFRNDHNGHNRDWLHADGYVSRPYVLPAVTVSFRSLSFEVGAFLAAGLEPLSGIPTRYYLA